MDAKTFSTELSGRLGLTPHEVANLCHDLADVMGEVLAQGDSLIVPSFGSFEPKKREEHVALHPSTGCKILVPPKLQVVFRPATNLRSKVRRSVDAQQDMDEDNYNGENEPAILD